MINIQRCVVRHASKCRVHGQITIDKILARAKSSGAHPTAGIIVIGDEILKAQVKDTNSFYACNLLYKHGVKVHKISMVRDDVEEIANEIKEFSKNFNYVFTSGGIGPTHDDVTYEAAALAFDDVLHYHPTLMDIVKNHFGCAAFPSPNYKMAYIPTKSLLKFGTNAATGKTLPYPCIVMQNVFISPGSPMFFEMSFRALCDESFAECRAFATDQLYVNAMEESFADVLSAVARECPNVSIGSYPERNRYYKVRITIESDKKEDTEMAKKMFCERVPSNVIVDYDKFVDYYEKPEKSRVSVDSFGKLVTGRSRCSLKRISRYTFHHFQQAQRKSVDWETRWPGLVLDTMSNCVAYNRIKPDRIDADLTIQHIFTALRPELQILLLGKRLNGNEREIYSCVSVRAHFPLINWTDEDVVNFVYSLFFTPLHHGNSMSSVRDGWQTGETLGGPGMSLEVESK